MTCCLPLSTLFVFVLVMLLVLEEVNSLLFYGCQTLLELHFSWIPGVPLLLLGVLAHVFRPAPHSCPEAVRLV